jgi:hypothetical protein
MVLVVKSGAMTVVGTLFEDAKELCELERFENCIHVAASTAVH